MTTRWRKAKVKPKFGDTIPAQKTFFDIAEQEKQTGIEVAYHNADTPWKKAACERVKELAKTRETFTAEEVVLWLKSHGIVTGENRAIGAIMQAFARAGIIEHQGFTESRRPECHKSPVRIWKSLTNKEGQNGKGTN